MGMLHTQNGDMKFLEVEMLQMCFILNRISSVYLCFEQDFKLTEF